MSSVAPSIAQAVSSLSTALSASNQSAVLTPTSLDSRDLYKMVYKDRSMIHTIYFHYPCNEDNERDRLQSAIARSKKYCDALRFRFIHCELFLVNLDAKEALASQTY